MKYFRKWINLFYKNYLNRPKAISPTIDITLLMAKKTIKSTAKIAIRRLKQKQNQPANNINQ